MVLVVVFAVVLVVDDSGAAVVVGCGIVVVDSLIAVVVGSAGAIGASVVDGAATVSATPSEPDPHEAVTKRSAAERTSLR